MIFRMLIPFILMLLLPDLYIYFQYIRHAAIKPLYSVVWWLPTVILTVWMTVAFVGQFQHASFMKYFFGAMLCFSIPKILFMLCSLLGKLIRLVGVKSQFSTVPMDYAGLFLGGVVFCVLVYGSFWGWRHLTVREVTYESPDLPAAFDGYRIAHFTDMHIGTQAGNTPLIQKAAQFINDQKADIICFTGDLVNSDPDELEPGFIQALSGLQAPDGVYSVMGNHDYSMYGRHTDKRQQAEAVKRLQEIERNQLHWNLLLNEHRIIHRGNDSIAILGVENDGNPPFPQYGDLPKTLKGISKGCFQVLLSHDPTHWRRKVLPETDVNLMLSGHTHATQFKLGGFSPSRFVYKEWDGKFDQGNRSLFVSSGMGAVMFPFRFGAWPEVVVITLKKSVK